MPAARHAPRVAALAALALAPALAGPARADEPAWLGSTQEERHEPEVVAWRRQEGWVRALARVALDPGRPPRERERAVVLLGTTGDDALALQTLVDLQHDDPRLMVHVQQALRRAWARRRVVEALAGATTPERAARVAAGLDAHLLPEVLVLARDPLFPGAAAAARVVGALPDDPSVDAVLVAVAGAGWAEARSVALEALAARGRGQALGEALAAALRAAAPGDEAARRATVEAVGTAVAREAVEALCRRAFAADVPEAARALAARGLARTPAAREAHQRAAPWLRLQLRGGGELAAAAGAALARLGAVEPEVERALLEAALAGGPAAHDAADGVLALAPERREALLRGALADPEQERRLRGLELVYAAGPAAHAAELAELARSLDAPWAARHLAVLALGRAGGAAAFAGLVAVLRQREPGAEEALLRRAAAAALGACPPGPAGRDEAAPARAALEAAAQDEGDLALRCAALEALGAWGAGPVVAAALERPARATAERLARVRAAERLGLVEPAAAARVLALAAEDPDPELALAALGYARALDDAAAVPFALGLLQHRQSGVRRAAGAELRRRRPTGAGVEDDEGAPLFSPEHTRATRAWRDYWERQRR